MSDECAASQKLKQLEHVVEQHSIILKGDDSTYPPKPGVMTVLKQISDQLSHPQSGNQALFESVRDIRAQDQRRISFFGGARWVVVILVGILTFILGLVADWFRH